MGVLVFCLHKKKIVLFLKGLQFRGLILLGAKSAAVFLELISHKDLSAVAQTVRTMPDTSSPRKGDREGDSTEYREKHYHKVMWSVSLIVLGMNYLCI